MDDPSADSGKAGIVRMTKVTAVGWARQFINVNAIACGTIATEMTGGLVPDTAHARSLPRNRVRHPSPLHSTLLYLVSPLSGAVTGTIVRVDDGQTPR